MENIAYCEYCDSPVDWVTTKRAAAILDVSEQRVRQLTDSGQLPFVWSTPSGRKKRFRKIPLAAVAARLSAREPE